MARKLAFTSIIVFALISTIASASVQSADNASDSSAIRVKYASGSTELATLQEGVQYFDNHPWTLLNIPPDVVGLTFTRRTGGKPANVEIDIPGAGTVYLLVDSDTGPNHAMDLKKRLAATGWTKIPGDASYTARGTKVCPISIYKQEVSSQTHLVVRGATWAGFVIAARDLTLDSGSTPNTPNAPPDNSPPTPQVPHVDLNGNGPITRITKLQSSIEALYVLEQPSGGMLGLASRLILTATPEPENSPPEKSDAVIPVSFATPVGHEMKIVLDEVARAINVHYHVSGIKKIEFSFDDKYTAKDGGSIGAAIGTLMLSVINSFDVDPKTAITGDVSADSKILPIGGVAAKLRGAAEAGCTVVALPAENSEQVRDALVYDGPHILTSVQAIGIATLDDAQAVCRADRAPDLAEAISLFAEIQKSLQDSPGYLYKPETIEKLHRVLALAPNHLSAQFLIMAAQHKLPRLTASASEYYTFVAVREYLATPTVAQTSAQVSDYSAQVALEKLSKLRPLSDLTVVPYIEAWSGYIKAIEDYRHNAVSARYVNDKNQEVVNEETKLNANRDLAEKMLREGI